MNAPVEDRPFNLITSRINGLVESRTLRRTGTSGHDSRFIGYLGQWSSFERSVREITNNINWDQHQNILQIRPGSLNAIHHEHYVCGDEKSVSARMVQNVFQVVTAVGKELGHGIEWGDGKASRRGMDDNNVVPDFVALINGTEHRLVGEIKTPWAHDIANAAENVTLDNELRRWLGQISKYMQEYKVKYGFYTTYKHTIFLKQEIRDNHWVLWYSRPIEFDTWSTAPARTGPVSLRECFLYLQTQIVVGNWSANNDEKAGWYVNKKGKKEGGVNLDRYYINDDPTTLPGAPDPNPMPALPAPYQRVQVSGANHQPPAGQGKEVRRVVPPHFKASPFIGVKSSGQSRAPERPRGTSPPQSHGRASVGFSTRIKRVTDVGR